MVARAFQAGRNSISALYVCNVKINQMHNPGCFLCISVLGLHIVSLVRGHDFVIAEERGWEELFDHKVPKQHMTTLQLLAGDMKHWSTFFSFFLPLFISPFFIREPLLMSIMLALDRCVEQPQPCSAPSPSSLVAATKSKLLGFNKGAWRRSPKPALSHVLMEPLALSSAC